MCASGVLGDCGKVRLSDGSDGSIEEACFPSDKELSDGGKMTSYQAGFNSIRDMCKRRACMVIVAKSDCPMDQSDKRVFRRTKSYPMEKK